VLSFSFASPIIGILGKSVKQSKIWSYLLLKATLDNQPNLAMKAGVIP